MRCVSVEGMTASVASISVDIGNDDVTSAGPVAEQRWAQSSVEVHRAESPSLPDQHITGSTLVVDAGEPLATELIPSWSLTMSADTPASPSHPAAAAAAYTDGETSSADLVSLSQHITA